MRSPWVNARPDELATGPAATFVTSVQVAGRRGVRLRNALLATSSSAPCSSTLTFTRLKRDGVDITAGPLSLEGSHRLTFTFRDEPRLARLDAGAAIDLAIEDDDGSGCVRVPLVGGTSAPRFRPKNELRYAMGARLRSFPLQYRDRGNVAPLGGAAFWFGVQDLAQRAYIEESASFTNNPISRASGHLALAAAYARKLSLGGPFEASLAFGYQLDGYFAREPGEERSRRHLLHGPELTPAVSVALVPGNHPATTLGGTLHLEIGVPTVVLLGAPNAEGATVVGGFTFGCFGVF